MVYSGKQFSFVSNFGHGVNDLFWFVFPLVLPLMLTTFGLSYGQAGGILTLYLLIIAVLSFLFGKLSDRSSKWAILGPGFFAASAGLILCGFMPNLGLLITFIIITAVGVSTFHPLMYASVDERTQLKKGNTFGKYEFWGFVAITTMFFIHGTLMKSVDWKQLLIITAAPGLIAAVIYTIGKPGPLPAEESNETPGAETGGTIPPRVFTLFLLSVLLRMLGTTATINFIPTYMALEVGMKSSLATYASGLFFLGGVAASIPAGKLSDKWGAFPTLNIAVLLMLPSIYILTLNVPYWLYGISIFLFGMGSGAGHPAHIMIASRLTNKMGTGQIFGIIMAIMTLVSALSPILQGLLADRISLAVAFRIFEIPLIASLVITIILTKSEKLYVLAKQT